MGVNSLPKTATRQRRDCDLNPALLRLSPARKTLGYRATHSNGRKGKINTKTYIKIKTGNQEYRMAQNKIPHRRICSISATGGLILKILEAA